MAKASRKGTRRQARMERRAHEEAQRRRSRQTRRLFMAGAAVAIALVATLVIWNATRPAPTASPPPAQPGSPSARPGVQPAPTPQIVQVPDQGRDHVAPGTAHPPYNSNPPTSGWHYAATAPWGFHNSELPDELIIHNLEHGGIWVTYKDATDEEVTNALVALAREFPRKLVITHRLKNDSRVAVASWARLMKLDRYDRAAIVDFYNRFKNKAPEFVPD